jgi:outer membrane protein assembly factor BamD
LGSYLGNNYLSCEIVAKNALKNYPSSVYQEDFSWLILQAKYQQMINSFEEKKLDRARETQDEYYNFITEFPDSKHRREADKMLIQIKKITKE